MIPTDARVAPDSRPGKIIGVGLNHAGHAAQVGRPAPRRPQIFLKAPSAVIGNGQAIVLPVESARVEHEAELAVVIGQTMRRVTARGALEGIAGYCCANDVTAQDVQRFDTFCPLGPIVPASCVDPHDLRIECPVNGRPRQNARTSGLLTPIADLVAHIGPRGG